MIAKRALASLVLAMAACGGTTDSAPPADAPDGSVADAAPPPQPVVDSGPSTDAWIDDGGVDAGPPKPGPCGVPYLGDPGAPIALEISAIGDGPNELTLADGGMAPMLTPPQGGRVIFVGVRATNLDPCGVLLGAALRDTASMQVRLDQRTVNLTARGDGWGTVGQPDGTVGVQADYANVPVCPNQWSARDVFGQPYELVVAVKDANAKQTSTTITVTPQCAGPDSISQPCTCICRAGYVLGQSCADAGAPRL